MSDPFAPSPDPDIPTPTRKDLLRSAYLTDREDLEAGRLPAKREAEILADLRRQWDEGHKRDAERRRAEQEARQEIGTPLAGGKTEELPPDSEFSGTFGDIKPVNDTTKGRRVPGEPDPDVPTEGSPNKDSSKAGGTKGVRVFGSRSGSGWTPESERHTRLRAFLHEQGLQAAYDAADSEQKQIIWAANERAFEDAERRKEQRRKRDLELRGRIFDALARVREDPTKKDLLPRDNASMGELEKWYEDTFTKPVPEKGMPGARPSPRPLHPHGDQRNVGASRDPERLAAKPKPSDEIEEPPDASREPLKRKGMEVSDLERLFETRDSTLEEKQSIEASLKRVLDSLPPRESGADTVNSLAKKIIEEGKPRFQNLADRELPEFRIASVMGPSDVTISEPESPMPPDQKKALWFDRIPVWKEFGPWLKWASAGFGFAVAMTQVNEYGWALAGLIFCGVCCLAQIYVWTASPNRFRNTITKVFLAVLSMIMIAISWMTVLRIKGAKPWSNLLEQSKTAQTDPTKEIKDQSNTSQPAPALTPSAVTIERAPLDVAPEKLLAFFEKYNEAQADELAQPYIGKWLEIRGRVIEVSRDPLIAKDGAIRYGITIKLETQRKDKPKSTILTQALFDEQRWIDRAKVVNRTETVSVRGRIKYVFSFGFSLEHCEIIE